MAQAASSVVNLTEFNNLDVLECTVLETQGLKENVECKQGIIFGKYEGATEITVEGHGHALFRGVKSDVNLSNFTIGNLELDYAKHPSILTDGSISIKSNEVIAGMFKLVFNSFKGNGTVIMPNLEQAFLTTTLEGQCNNAWYFVGHSNIVVLANEIQQGCNIRSTGGETATSASLTIDFGFDSRFECLDGNEVVVSRGQDGYSEVSISRPDLTSRVLVQVAPIYNFIKIKMSKCKDIVRVHSTPDVEGSIAIQTGDDDDFVYLGNDNSGLDAVYRSITIETGSGQDKLVVNDSGSLKKKDKERLTAGSLEGVLNNPEDLTTSIEFTGVELFDIYLSQGKNIMEVESTATDSVTTIVSQDAPDQFRVKASAGTIVIHAGGGDDQVWIDGTDDFALPAINRLAGTHFKWSGGHGNDAMHLKLGSLGNVQYDLFDDRSGVNALNIDCSGADDVLLSRENFLANIHNVSDPDTTIERINLIRDDNEEELSGWFDTAIINTIVLRLNSGENKMYFDDTFAPIDVLGGGQTDGMYFLLKRAASFLAF